MKWRIDNERKLLILDANYEIDFDRLEETDWFDHLASKNWVDMQDLFEAFISAFKAADRPLDEAFFNNFHKAYKANVDDKFYSMLLKLRYEKDDKLFYRLSELKSNEVLINEIISQPPHLSVIST
jgi:hypothetical protein